MSNQRQEILLGNMSTRHILVTLTLGEIYLGTTIYIVKLRDEDALYLSQSGLHLTYSKITKISIPTDITMYKSRRDVRVTVILA